MQAEFNQPTRLVIATLPVDKIAQGRKAVAAGGASIDAALPPLTGADLSAARSIKLGATSDVWSVEPDPAPRPISLVDRPIQLGDGKGEVKAVRFGRDGTKVAVMRLGPGVRGPPFKPAGNVMESYDTATGEPVETFELPAMYELMDVSPDGNLALLGIQYQKRGLGGQNPERDRLDIWAFEEGSHATGWRPYMDRSDVKSRNVHWAAFLDERHVVTLSTAGELILWTLPQCKAEYIVQNIDPVTAISPGGKYLAVKFQEENAFRLIEAATGAMRGHLESPTSLTRPSGISFRPDGQAFALFGGRFTVTWLLADGSLQYDVSHPMVSGSSIAWFDQGHLLLGNRTLLNSKSEMLVWSYRLNFGCHAQRSPDDRHWYAIRGSGGFGPNQPYYLGAVEMPSLRVLLRTGKLKVEDVALLYPGATAAVSVDLPIEDNQKLLQSLTEKLEANGVTVDRESPVRVSLSGQETTTGVEVRARGFGRSRNETQRFQQRQIEYVLRVTDGADRKYEQKGSMPMRTSGTVRSENARAELTAEMRRSAAYAAGRFEIPKYVFPNDVQAGLGVSNLTFQGEVLPNMNDSAASRP